MAGRMKSILKFFVLLCRDICEEMVIMPLGLLYYLMFYKHREGCNLILCEHIGDIVFTLGYIGAFKEKNKVSKVTILSTEKWRDLCLLFPNSYDEYKSLKKWELKLFLIIFRFSLGQAVFNKIGGTIVINPGDNYNQGYEYAKRFPGANLKDTIKYGILKLSEDDIYQAPTAGLRIGKVEVFKHKYQFKERKCILLCPYATVTVTAGTRNEIFKRLAKALLKKGYRVFTNAVDEQSVIEGTEGISCSLNELFEIGRYFEGVIGIRSGVMDLLAFEDVRMVALFPEKSEYEEFFDLRLTNPENTKISQYRLTADIEYDMEKILNLMNLGGEKNEC